MIAALVASLIANAAVAKADVTALPQLIGRRPRIELGIPTQSEVFTISDLEPGHPFTEVIPSWNIKHSARSRFTIELRGKRFGTPTAWYRMADWTLDASVNSRTSVNGQKDEDATVSTDTVIFKHPMDAIDIRISSAVAEGEHPMLDLVSATFSDVILDEPAPIRSAAWGKAIGMGKRYQNKYPDGHRLCSPTSTSMLLLEASKRTGLPVDRDVPQVVPGLYDTGYEGAGNWSFNAAFYGQFDGLSGYVSRFGSISDLEQFIEKDIPVAVSVDLNRLRGTPKAVDSGHLVVLVGFSKTGDPIFLDPAVGQEEETTYTRQNFDSAWRRSGRAVYVFAPSRTQFPRSNGRWLE